MTCPPPPATMCKTMEQLSGAPVSAVGVGPRRDQTLQIRPLL